MISNSLDIDFVYGHSCKKHVFSFSGKEFQYPDAERKRPAVPKPDDKPIMGLKTTKNFITQNAVENIMSVTKKPEKNYADTRIGDKHPLDPSGLEPHYIHKKVGGFDLYLANRSPDKMAAILETTFSNAFS